MVRTSVVGIGAALAVAGVVLGGFLLLHDTSGSMHTVGAAAVRSICSPDAWEAWWGSPRPAPDAHYTVEVRDGQRVEITVPAGDHYGEIRSTGAILRAADDGPPTCAREPRIQVFHAAGSGTATVSLWTIDTG